MKYLLSIIFVTFSISLFSQSITRDSIWFFTELNPCDSSVWWMGYQVKYRNKVISVSSNPIGYDEKNPCANQIMARDTSTLVNYYKNSLIIDPGREIAGLALKLFQSQSLDKEADRFNSAIKIATKKDLFLEIEKSFADSLFGTYRLRINTGTVTTVDCTITRRANGQIVIRTGSGQNVQNYPLKFYGDEKIEVTNLPRTGDKTIIFQIGKNKKRWSSIGKDLQVLGSDKLVIENLSK